MLVCLRRQTLQFCQLAAVLGDELHFVFHTGDLRDAHLQGKEILLLDVFYTGVHIYQDEYRIVNDIVDLQRLDPCGKRYIGQLVFHSQMFNYFRPFFLYDIHCGILLILKLTLIYSTSIYRFRQSLIPVDKVIKMEKRLVH